MANFQEIINSNKPVLVDFFATWCGPCKIMLPLLQNLKKRISNEAIILKIDIDKNPQAASVYGVQSVPTLILFKNGEIKWRKSGVVQTEELEQIISQNL